MFIKRKRMTAIDIGTSSAKIVAGYIGDGFLHVDRYTYVPLPQNYREFHTIAHKDVVVQGLKKALSDIGIRRGRCVLSITSPDLITRQMVLPDMPEQSLKENILYELNQYVPIDVNRYVIDYRFMDSRERQEPRGISLMALAVPKHLLEDVLDITHQIKMDVYAIDVDFNGRFKLFRFLEQVGAIEKGLDTMIIDLGYESSQVVLYSNDYIFINKDISRGGRDISFMLANALGTEPQDAENALKRYELKRDADPVAYNAVVAVLDNIAADIMRVLDYFNARYRGHQIQRIYLTGGVSRINGVAQYFQQALDIPASVIKDGTWLRLPDMRNGKPSFDISVFATALGLLLREV